jgi:hypothetical protein
VTYSRHHEKVQISSFNRVAHFLWSFTLFSWPWPRKVVCDAATCGTRSWVVLRLDCDARNTVLLTTETRKARAEKKAGRQEYVAARREISDGGAADFNDVMAEWSQIFIDAGERMGKSFEIADQAAFHIRDAGFVDMVERWYKAPVGLWLKDKRLRENRVVELSLLQGRLRGTGPVLANAAHGLEGTRSSHFGGEDEIRAQ